MQLNPVIESFYKGLLEYAGLSVDEGGAIHLVAAGKPLKNKAGKFYHLPYIELMKNAPEGKAFIHPLNENYFKPESEFAMILKNNLVLFLNMRLVKLMDLLMDIGSDPVKQKLLKKKANVELVTNLGQLDDSQLNLVSQLLKRAVEQEPLEPFFSVFIKKNAKFKGEAFSATGTINFRLFKEAEEALQGGSPYSMFGSNVRKKDAIAISNIMRAIFPGLEDEDNYTETTDNKLFRWLNILLRTCYLVSNRINEIVLNLSKDLFDSETNAPLISNHDWVADMETLCNMENEIKVIKNQDNIQDEANQSAEPSQAVIGRMPKNEGMAVNAQVPQNNAVPAGTTTFNPSSVPQEQTQQQQQQPQNPQPYTQNPMQMPQPPTLEDIVYGRVPHPAQLMTYQTNQIAAMQNQQKAMMENPYAAMYGMGMNMGMGYGQPTAGNLMAGGVSAAYSPLMPPGSLGAAHAMQQQQRQMQQQMQQQQQQMQQMQQQYQAPNLGLNPTMQNIEQQRYMREQGMLNNMAYTQPTTYGFTPTMTPPGNHYGQTTGRTGKLGNPDNGVTF